MIRWLGACPLYLLCCCALAGEMDCNVLRERASTAASSSELITAFDAARHCGNALTDARPPGSAP
ncbi:MAG: hypothetical protein R3E84_21375 [Pseudomonadales bacterium]